MILIATLNNELSESGYLRIPTSKLFRVGSSALQIADVTPVTAAPVLEIESAIEAMLIKEYRIPLPLSVDEYKIAQLYMIAVSRKFSFSVLSAGGIRRSSNV